LPDRAIGILDSKSQKVKDGGDVAKYLIINRIVPEMVQSGEMLKSDDILDILNIRLIGKIPEDNGVIDASNQGKPIILDDNSIAGQAYKRISARLCGKKGGYERCRVPPFDTGTNLKKFGQGNN